MVFDFISHCESAFFALTKVSKKYSTNNNRGLSQTPTGASHTGGFFFPNPAVSP